MPALDGRAALERTEEPNPERALIAAMLLALACIALRGRAAFAFVVGFSLLFWRFLKVAVAGLAAFLGIA